MKKTFTIITILILFTLVLTACGASNSPQANVTGNNNTSNGNGSNGNSGNNNSFTNTPLPLAPELVVGTFKLEGTANAVTAKEAANLLPLWQVYKDLSTSSSAAQQEIDALAQQIQGTMTPDQVKAITDMKLTRRDLFTTMQTLGIAPTGGPTASGTPRPGGGQGGNGFGGGNFPGGGNGVPGGGQGFNNGQTLTPQQLATLQARRSQNGGSGRGNRIPPALYDALIKLLQNKK